VLTRDKIGIHMNTLNFIYNHYDYLDDHLDLLWQKVFGKTLDEMWCSGIIGAHGDKGYGYRRRWEDVGISFTHGMMLFMLTYTDVMDRPKHESLEWTIENYEKYLPLIREAEIEARIVDENGTVINKAETN